VFYERNPDGDLAFTLCLKTHNLTASVQIVKEEEGTADRRQGFWVVIAYGGSEAVVG
jgi:hypothetical protein